MSNPYGWGQNEPQIKPKDQGGDTIATFSQKIYNLFDTLFNTLNSYPWSPATQTNAGYMSAADKAALDNVSIQTGTWTPVLKGGTTDGAFTTSSGGNYIKLGNLVYIYGRIGITACTSIPSGNVMISGLPYVAYGNTGDRNMTIPCRANGLDNNSAQKIFGLFVAGNTSNLIARVPAISPTLGVSMFNEGVWSTTSADSIAVKVTQGSYTGTAIVFAGWYISK